MISNPEKPIVLLVLPWFLMGVAAVASSWIVMLNTSGNVALWQDLVLHRMAVAAALFLLVGFVTGFPLLKFSEVLLRDPEPIERDDLRGNVIAVVFFIIPMACLLSYSMNPSPVGIINAGGYLAFAGTAVSVWGTMALFFIQVARILHPRAARSQQQDNLAQRWFVTLDKKHYEVALQHDRRFHHVVLRVNDQASPGVPKRHPRDPNLVGYSTIVEGHLFTVYPHSREDQITYELFCEGRSTATGASILAGVPAYYQILGVPTYASRQEIQEAYRQATQLIERRRGELLPQQQARLQKFEQNLAQAYAVLSHPRQRAAYDARHHLPQRRDAQYGFLRIVALVGGLLILGILAFVISLFLG